MYFGTDDGHVYIVPLVVPGDDDYHHEEIPSSTSTTTTATLSLRPHTTTIHAMGVDGSGSLLVTASADGTAKVIDLQSRTVLREATASPGAKYPVVDILVIPRPLFLLSAAAGHADGTTRFRVGLPQVPAVPVTRRGPKRGVPMPPLAKFAGPLAKANEWDGPVVLLEEAARGGDEEHEEDEGVGTGWDVGACFR